MTKERRAVISRDPYLNNAGVRVAGTNHQEVLTNDFTAFVAGNNIFNDRDQQLADQDGTPDRAKFEADSEYGMRIQPGLSGRFLRISK